MSTRAPNRTVEVIFARCSVRRDPGGQVLSRHAVGVPPTPCVRKVLQLPSVTEMSAVPEAFRQAVASLTSPASRPEIEITEVRPPKRLAPWAHALAAEATGPAGELATSRLVLLHDPAGQESWNGAWRLVVYLGAELDPEVATDPLLPSVGWSWLTDALENSGAEHTALGGTVTLTSSARFGDIAGPELNHDLELRGSWTALGPELESHAVAFHELMSTAAGLPPTGVAVLGPRTDGGQRPL